MAMVVGGESVKRQARAEATRRRIIDAAVGLFGEIGYGQTGLADIVKAADVTKGAFYYHFSSREAVADAIITEGNEHLAAVYSGAIRDARPALENLIVGTYALASAIRSEELVGISNLLVQSLSQIGDAGSQVYPRWKSAFLSETRKAAMAGELRDGVDPEDAGEAICASMVGSQLLSDAIGDDVFGRLTRSWHILLRAVAPAHALPGLEGFLLSIQRSYEDTPG